MKKDTQKQTLSQLDQDILKIQKSTKTLVPFMIFFHDCLRRRYIWYYNWHLRDCAKIVHLFVLSAVFLTAILVVGYTLVGFPKHVKAATATLRPNGDYGTQEWSVTGCTNHFDCVKDATANDSTFLGTILQDAADVFDMSSATVTNVSQVVVYVRAQGELLSTRPVLGVDLYIGSWQGTKTYQTTSSFATTSFTYTGSWSQTQLNSMRVKIYRESATPYMGIGPGILKVSQVYAVITYTTSTAPSVTTNAASSITSSGASLNGNITSTGGATVTTRGFRRYTGSSCPGGYTTISQTGSYGTGSYSLSTSGLDPNTAYSYQAFATNSVGTSTGSCVNFTTLANAPTVTTSSASSITSSGAQLNGNITATGGANATTRGFKRYDGGSCGGTATDVSQTGSYGTGAYSLSASGLSANTQYSYKAFATNSGGTGEGSCVQFTTLADPPTVTTQSASSITSSSAVGNGNITATGGQNATVRGFKYSQGASCTDATTVSESGSYGTGAFSLEATDLIANTQYSYRAFATNTGGTGYGSCVQFTTLPEPPLAPSNVTISSINTTSFTVNWTDNSDDEDGFKVYISTNPADSCSAATYSGSPDYTTAADATLQTVSGLSINSRYCVKVVAYNAAAGDSDPAFSNPKYTLANLPGTPTVEMPVDTSDSDTLKIIISQNGNPEGDGNSHDTEYALYNQTDNCWLNLTTGNCDAAENWYTYQHGDPHWGGVSGKEQHDLTPNTEYTYQVKARNGDSVATSLSSANSQLTRAATPGAPNISLPDDEESTTSLNIIIDRNGNPQGGGASGDTQYAIYNQTLGKWLGTDGAANQNSEVWVSFSDWNGALGKDNTNLSTNTNYIYQVKAKNENDEESPLSSGAGLYTRIEVITAIDFTAQATNSITLAPANSPTNLDLGSSGVRLCNTTFDPDDCSSWQKNTNPWESLGLSANTQYSFSIQSRNGNGVTTAKAIDQKYTLANQVTGASATASYNETDGYKVALSWNLNGASLVRVARVSPATDVYSGSGVNYDDNLLEANTNYIYRIYSVNGASEENENYAEISATTPPAVPSDLSGVDITPHTAKATWGAVAGATAFEFCYGTNSGAADNLGCHSAGANEFYDLTILSSGTEYFYKVRASNAHGNGAFSHGTGVGSAALPYPSFTTTSTTRLHLKLPGQDFTSGVGVTGVSANQDAGVGFNFDVYATDENNLLVTDETGTVRVSASDSQGELPADADLVGGTRSFDITLKTANLQSISAIYLAGGATSGTQVLTINPDVFAVGESAVSLDTNTLYVNNFATLTIYIKDQFGNGLSGHTISVASDNPGDTIDYLINPTESSGMARVRVSSAAPQTSTFTITNDSEGVDLLVNPQVTWVPEPVSPPSSPPAVPTEEPAVDPVISLSTPRRIVVGTTVEFSAGGLLKNVKHFEWNISPALSKEPTKDRPDEYIDAGAAITSLGKRITPPADEESLTSQKSDSEVLATEKVSRPKIWYQKVKDAFGNLLEKIREWFKNRFSTLPSFIQRVYARVTKKGKTIYHTFDKTGYYQIKLAAMGSDASAETTEEIVVIPEVPKINAVKNVGKNIVIFGTGTPGTRVEIFFSPSIDGAAVGRANVDNLGSWTFAYPADKFYQGKYIIYAVGVDKNNVSGDTSERVDFVVNLDGEVTETSLIDGRGLFGLSPLGEAALICVLGLLLLAGIIIFARFCLRKHHLSQSSKIKKKL